MCFKLWLSLSCGDQVSYSVDAGDSFAQVCTSPVYQMKWVKSFADVWSCF